MSDSTKRQKADGPDPLDRLTAGQARALRMGGRLSTLAALLWLPQAGLLALALADALAGRFDRAPLAVAGFVVLGLARAILASAAEGRLFAAGEAIAADARAGLIAREVRRGPGEAAGPGAIAALAAEKLDMILPFVTRYAPARTRATVLPLVIMAVAFPLSWAVGIVFLITGPLIPVFQALVGMAAKEASRRQLAEVGSLNDLLVDRLSALTAIRMLDAGDRVASGFAAASEALRARTMAVLRIAFLSSTVLEMFAAIGVAMVAVWCGFALLGTIGWGAWGGPISAFAAIWLLLLAPDFYQPLRDLSAAWHDKAAAEAMAEELIALEADLGAPLLGSGGRADPLPGPATLRLSGAAVEAGAGRIRFPDLAIAAGETVAVTGPSGAGKTTLLCLLAGLRAPDAGQIMVADQRLDTATADAWRARIGWMPQGAWFANESLRAAITGGRPGDLGAALALAAVDPVIAALPQGLETRLGERGVGLSGGEARRVVLARALYGAPDVILADEPTADLDAETAAAVTAGLLAQAARGATLIVATHDPALAAQMDRAVAIGGGA